ncbi:hypothetical protein BJY04DRAFT_50974 [Aspergillus karnatakaensis]|uniref:uncharacterized protein n=1 Tax=Aspergillus karnatakaensis TaxID=1810916 RepID=UPI003CCCEBF3
MLSQISTTALLSSLLLTAANAQSNAANCSVFNWDNNPASISTYPPERVGAAGTCPENESNLTCALTASGDAQYTANVNITGLNIVNFAEVVQSTVDNSTLEAPGFNASIAGAIDTTRILEPGQSAYLNFTAYQFCYTGTVGNCSEGVDNETAVEVCAPLWREDGFPRIDGTYTVVNVSANDVDRYPDPYENQVRPEDAAVSLLGGLNMGLVGLLALGAAMVV